MTLNVWSSYLYLPFGFQVILCSTGDETQGKASTHARQTLYQLSLILSKTHLRMLHFTCFIDFTWRQCFKKIDLFSVSLAQDIKSKRCKKIMWEWSLQRKRMVTSEENTYVLLIKGLWIKRPPLTYTRGREQDLMVCEEDNDIRFEAYAVGQCCLA